MERHRRIQQLTFFWLLSGVAQVLLALAYADSIIRWGNSASMGWLEPRVLIGLNTLFFFSTLSLPIVLLAEVAPAALSWMVGVSQMVSGFALAILYVDIRTRGFAGVHLSNAIVFQEVSNPDLAYELHFGLSMALHALLGVMAIALVVWLMWRLSGFAASRWSVRRSGLVWIAIVVLLLWPIDRWAEMRSQHLGDRLNDDLPWKALLITGNRHAPVAHLTYTGDVGGTPVPHRAKRPSVVMILSESFRSDELTPTVTPNLWKLAHSPNCFIAPRHYSSATSTEFGVYSLLYGLDAHYYTSGIVDHPKSFPLQLLHKMGYEVRGAAACLLRGWNDGQYVYTNFDHYQEYADHHDWRDDWELARSLRDFLAKRGPGAPPFFQFIFFNASHYNYSFPPEQVPFQPIASGDLDYFESPSKLSKLAKPIHNRQLNSFHYLDSLWGELIATLKPEIDRGELIFILSGDHGEEFWEKGMFAHFTLDRFIRERTQVSFGACFPPHYLKDHPADTVARVSSHPDVFPTVLDALGVSRAELNSHFSGEPILGGVDSGKFVIVTAPGFPSRARKMVANTANRKYWLKARGAWPDDLEIEKITDLEDNVINETDDEMKVARDLLPSVVTRLLKFYRPYSESSQGRGLGAN